MRGNVWYDILLIFPEDKERVDVEGEVVISTHAGWG
jgi:hypothetical protein